MWWSTSVSKFHTQALKGATKEPLKEVMAHADTVLDILNNTIQKACKAFYQDGT